MTQAAPQVGIVTLADDIHGIGVAHRLASLGVAASVFETDTLPGIGQMNWRPGGDFRMRDRAGDVVRVADIELMWWRRLPDKVSVGDDITDPAARDMILRDCRATLLGGVMTAFSGRWVSHPEKTQTASNKLIQLEAAATIGLRLPRTLISQDPTEIRAFYDAMHGAVVVKTVAGTRLQPLLTGKLTPEMLSSDAPLTIAPAIYQHLIEGDHHLRICMFGDKVFAARLTSSRLDWRHPLDVEAEPVAIADGLQRQMRALLDALGLRMGIFDFKEADDGEPVFLEVNPQGQFLFLEGLCGLPLNDAFADFLVDELALARLERQTRL